jgi:hypothetical protein
VAEGGAGAEFVAEISRAFCSFPLAKGKARMGFGLPQVLIKGFSERPDPHPTSPLAKGEERQWLRFAEMP